MNNKTIAPQGSSVRVTGGFWKSRMDMVASELIPYQWKALNDEIEGAEPSHSIENFKIAAGESSGKFLGTIFQDSDVAKWLEAASYTLVYKPDAALDARLDEVIRVIAKAQRPDGYLNTYFTVAAPEKRWKDLIMGHELYCAGHLIEAGVAHHAATGKRTLLDVVCRYADAIDKEFGPAEGQNHGFCGHPEVELALYRLADATGVDRYRKLADHFVDIRGTVPNFHVGVAAMDGMIPTTRWFEDDYYLADQPVRMQVAARGHAVRAMYLYTAMADSYSRRGDATLLGALDRVWESTTQRRMTITAGLGSQAHGERFTVDHDLPPATAYAETCASIGLVFWAWRMLQIQPDARYADTLELSLYNGSLSGLSLDGKRYFYVNPLEVVPRVSAFRYDHQHVATSRVAWFGCSCCPPNIARLIASVGQYVSTHNFDTVWIHQYMDSRVEASELGVTATQSTNYPWEGQVALSVETETTRSFGLRLRIPGWCKSFSVAVNGVRWNEVVLDRGYAVIGRLWSDGDVVDLTLDMPVRFVRSHPSMADTAGKVAIQRGPLIYCAEEADNGTDLHNLVVDTRGPASTRFDSQLMEGTQTITVKGLRVEAEPTGPYDDSPQRLAEQPLVLVPYHRWGNRAPGQEMRVWVRSLP